MAVWGSFVTGVMVCTESVATMCALSNGGRGGAARRTHSSSYAQPMSTKPTCEFEFYYLFRI